MHLIIRKCSFERRNRGEGGKKKERMKYREKVKYKA